MTTRPAFVSPNMLGLSLASIALTATNYDFSQGYGEAWEIIAPSPTIADVDERTPELLDDRDDAAALRADPAQGLDADLKFAWEQSDAGSEFRDSFLPMMNIRWPVELGYQVEAQAAADLMHEFAGATALVEFGAPGDDPDYYIVLTGGGMNLSDHIAAAYLCCGCVPPLELLTGLADVAPSSLLARLPMAEAYARAQDWLEGRAAALARNAAEVAAPAA